MMARRGVLGALIGGLAAFGLSGCGSTRRMRYKMTIEVETAEGLRTGSAVREVTADPGSNAFPFGENKGSRYLKGEAVAVDLPGDKTLFALLTSASGNVDYAKALPSELMGWGSDEGLTEGVVELWPNTPLKPSHGHGSIPHYLPMLVTFQDIGDPKSVEAVEPGALEASFGPGVRLRRITVEQSDEPITEFIQKRLIEYGVQVDRNLDSDFKMTTDPTLAQRLGYKDFVQGAAK